MKRLLATISLWLILYIVCAPAIPPDLTSITRDAGTGIVITWDGNGGSTFTVARSDESVTNWQAIATSLTDMVYTDSVVSASSAHYRVEEEPSNQDRLELTAIYVNDATNIVIEWSGNSSNTFSVSRSEGTATNWMILAANLTEMIYTDTTAVATLAWYRVEAQEGGTPPVVVADFAGTPTNGPAPLVVTFTNLSSGASEYAWDFGDGHTSTNEHPLNTFSNEGNYTVTLTAIGAGGTSALTRTDYIVVTNPPPPVLFEDDFETGGKPGWTNIFYDSFENTIWEVGTPSNVGPPSANNGTNLYATNLDDYYGFSSDIGLQTPIISLSNLTSATFSFAHWYHTVEDEDYIEVLVKDMSGGTLATLLPEDSGVQTNWTGMVIDIPAQALGQEVRFEFHFTSTFLYEEDGWYIDDIVVKGTP